MALSAALTVAGTVLVLATQNVEYTLPPGQAQHDISQASEYSSVVVAQEMEHRRAQHFAPPGFRSVQGEGQRGNCATYWRPDHWRLVRWRPVRLGRRWGQVSVFRPRLAVVCVHFGTHPAERARERAKLAPVVESLAARMPVVVAGDWNTPWRFRPRFIGYSSRRPGRDTRYGRRIDYAEQHRARVVREHVVTHTFSDHNGVRLRLRLQDGR